MSVIMRSPSIALGSVNENVFSGSAFEFARQRQIVSVGVTQAATGMFATLSSGVDIIAEEFEPPIQTRYPIIPDEMYFSDVQEVGDRLVLRVRNPTGGAIIARAVAQTSAFS